MRIATSTNLFGYNRERTNYTSTIECIKRCSDAGFKVIDMNFCPIYNYNYTEFCDDDYIEQALKIRKFADESGVVFYQSHIPFSSGYMPRNSNEDTNSVERLLERTNRAIMAGEILGVKWAVVHPYTDIRYELDNRANLEYNLKFYTPIVEMLKKHGQGMAIENMFTLPDNKFRRKYCEIAEELIELIDAFNDPCVGACWDFGHAHIMYEDQTIPLRKMGKRLKATHVADNKRFSDSHLLPFSGGTIKWEAIMPVLKEIEYEGDFTFEAHCFTDKLPDKLRDPAAQFCYKTGQYLVKL